MPLSLPPEEPAVEHWQVRPFDEVAAELLVLAGAPAGRPPVVVVDGRGAGGKTSFAERLGGAVPGSAVVHTDDVAWNHAIMDWADLLVAGVLEPVRRGEAVRFRPPAWDRLERTGAIEVPASCTLLIIEGVGAGRRSLAPYIDALVWVQSDFERARERGLVRDGGTAEVAEFWDVWALEEDPFFAADRPWERADMIICGTPEVAHDRASDVVVGSLPTDGR